MSNVRHAIRAPATLDRHRMARIQSTVRTRTIPRPHDAPIVHYHHHQRQHLLRLPRPGAILPRDAKQPGVVQSLAEISVYQRSGLHDLLAKNDALPHRQPWVLGQIRNARGRRRIHHAGAELFDMPRDAVFGRGALFRILAGRVGRGVSREGGSAEEECHGECVRGQRGVGRLHQRCEGCHGIEEEAKTEEEDSGWRTFA
mmetsp:Transcript_19369/g.31353  ORF Transcript_19369/g.31353 Transcript_19369/m.31353 type:complete len:200 (-) Transcript_19369:525-1124(-)